MRINDIYSGHDAGQLAPTAVSTLPFSVAGGAVSPVGIRLPLDDVPLPQQMPVLAVSLAEVRASGVLPACDELHARNALAEGLEAEMVDGHPLGDRAVLGFPDHSMGVERLPLPTADLDGSVASDRGSGPDEAAISVGLNPCEHTLVRGSR